MSVCLPEEEEEDFFSPFGLPRLVFPSSILELRTLAGEGKEEGGGGVPGGGEHSLVVFPQLASRGGGGERLRKRQQQHQQLLSVVCVYVRTAAAGYLP